MLIERAPPGFQIKSEHRLTLEPQRADLLILRSGDARVNEARTLKRLWSWLGEQTIGEFKSISHSFRFGDLARLMGYAWQYRAQHGERLRPDELTLLLVVPDVSPSLRDEIAENGWKMEPLDGGYHRVDTGVYWLYVVVIDDVAEAERDALLSLFGHHPRADAEARRWFGQFVMSDEETRKKMQEMEDYDALVKRFLAELPPEVRLAGLAPEVRLAGLAPELRLAGLAPEQRVADLSVEERLLVMPDEALRLLPDAYLDRLSPATREAIRRRIGR